MESEVFDVVSVTSSRPPLKINPKGVYPMESNVFDVVPVTSSSSHCPLSSVLPQRLTLKVYIQWNPMCLMSCLLPLVVPTVPCPPPKD